MYVYICMYMNAHTTNAVRQQDLEHLGCFTGPM